MIATGSTPSALAPSVWVHGAEHTQLRERPISCEFGVFKEDFAPAVTRASSGSDQRDAVSIIFGPFRLCPMQRLLLEGNQPLHVGSRALDILIALLERPGEVLSKKDLIARVWRGIVVDEANLKVHVAALRRALRDGQPGNRYICTVPGRGYSFVAPFVRTDNPMPNNGANPWHHSPASQAAATFDRELIGTLAARLTQQRFVTAVGVGDMVKGLILAAALLTDYQHGVRFVDLAGVNDPLLVPSAVGEGIGLAGSNRDPAGDVAAFLRDKHILLVLDNCCDVLGASASFATSLLDRAPRVRILAVSR